MFSEDDDEFTMSLIIACKETAATTKELQTPEQKNSL